MIGLQSGSVFAERYEILAPIGAGGMGAVYLACNPRKRDFLVALKVLDASMLNSKEALTRFRNEIVATYGVDHPNIVRAYEYFDQADFQAYAMEYVDGGTLKNFLQSGPLDPTFTTNILLQVSAGLEAVHAKSIVHRDLKPENLLMSKKGVVKISDFGVARLQGAQAVTHVGALVGTAQYVAPEYIETGECDHRGDIYALGVIGYEMLSGTSPFKSQSTVTAMLERFNNRPPALRELLAHCPPELARIVEKAMSIRIAERYQSATEMRADLERLQHQLLFDEAEFEAPKAARLSAPDPLIETMRLPPQAHLLRPKNRTLQRRILIAGMGVLAGVVALGIVYAGQQTPPREKPMSVEEQRYILLGP
ncbi:MAG: serine/threonine protein kinase [Deltaproteobacteria bacterium]|nr:serine/threonine protein kinase [Deltaproteobacteria bacterium]